jgi:hypothetical protein
MVSIQFRGLPIFTQAGRLTISQVSWLSRPAEVEENGNGPEKEAL